MHQQRQYLEQATTRAMTSAWQVLESWQETQNQATNLAIKSPHADTLHIRPHLRSLLPDSPFTVPVLLLPDITSNDLDVVFNRLACGRYVSRTLHCSAWSKTQRAVAHMHAGTR